VALAENLEVTVGGDVNDGHLLFGGGLWWGLHQHIKTALRRESRDAAVRRIEQSKANATRAQKVK
jgi:hypothetical protein